MGRQPSTPVIADEESKMDEKVEEADDLDYMNEVDDGLEVRF